MRTALTLAAILFAGVAQAQIDSNTMNGDIPGMKMSRDTPLALCAPPAAAVVGKVLRYQGYPMRVSGIVSEESIAAVNAVGVALMFVGGGMVTYCKGDLVRVRAIPVPGFPAPPQYEPDPSEPNGSWDVLPESRQVEETKVEQD
jgi:hypothetical protein